jgi:hypothetical protein
MDDEGVVIERMLEDFAELLAIARRHGPNELTVAMLRYTAFGPAFKEAIISRPKLIHILEARKFSPLNISALIQHGHLRLDG